MPQQENTSSTYVDDLRDAMRRGDGLEYAAAVGLISAIARPSRYGRYGTRTTTMTQADRLDEICRVLDALDVVTDPEDEAPRGTDDAEEHAPKPVDVDGYTHKRGQPFGAVES